MTKSPDKNLIVGLDIGTSKVVAIATLAGDQQDLRSVRSDEANSQVIRPSVVNVDHYIHVANVPGEVGDLDRRCNLIGAAGIDRNELNAQEFALHL